MERAALGLFAELRTPPTRSRTTHVGEGTGHRARTWNYSLNSHLSISNPVVLSWCATSRRTWHCARPGSPPRVIAWPRMHSCGRKVCERESDHQVDACFSRSWLSASLPRFSHTQAVPGLSDELLVGVGFGGQCALEEPVEQQASVASSTAVEAEGELIEVVVQLGVADGALVGPEDPALEQRGDEVNVRQRDVRGVPARGHVGHHVVEPVAADLVVADPGVGPDLTAAGHVVEHEVGSVSRLTFTIRRIRTRSGASSPSTAITTIVLCPKLRPPTLVCLAPTYVSSTSTTPESSSRPGSTIARRSLCRHAHAVW